MTDLAYQFQLNGKPVYCERYGNGHINETYLLRDTSAREYILQKINRHIFRDPASLMKNVGTVISFLKERGKNHRESLTLIPTNEGKLWYCDEQGEYWRLYVFINDSICLQKAETPDDFRESGVAFGRFMNDLALFPAEKLTETIPRFHDTPNRYRLFKESLASDAYGRVKEAQKEIDFLLEREGYASTLIDLQMAGALPRRVTHNDTKLNNVLFDRFTRKALCVIDLDTIMPGLAVTDFGDSIRFGASTGAEDEQDLDKITLSLPLLAHYASGYLSACGKSLTDCEIEHLRDGAKIITLENGVRFLTDYLAGDVYYRTTREGQNLDRCRTQLKMVSEMEKHWDEMQYIIMENGGKK